MKCEICGKDNIKILQTHMKNQHPEINLEEYFLKYIGHLKKCEICGEKASFISLGQGYNKLCNKHPKNSAEWKTWWFEGCKPGKEAMIKRHGKKKGSELWNDAQVKRQWKNSKAGLQETFGKEGYKELAKKLNTAEKIKQRYIKEYGEEKGLELFHKKRCEDTNRSVEYWLKKGFSMTEATKKVSEIQKTFSLDICIEKYGKEKGIKIWKTRQKKWQNTLNSKSEKEKIRICKAKIPHTISKPEKELKETLNCESQIYIEGKLFDLGLENKLIEFNGGYWHCDPREYSPDFYHKIKKCYARDIWDNDSKKLQIAYDNGYKVLVIWEKEWKENKENVIKEARNFLYG